MGGRQKSRFDARPCVPWGMRRSVRSEAQAEHPARKDGYYKQLVETFYIPQRFADQVAFELVPIFREEAIKSQIAIPEHLTSASTSQPTMTPSFTPWKPGGRKVPTPQASGAFLPCLLWLPFHRSPPVSKTIRLIGLKLPLSVYAITFLKVSWRRC